MVDTGTAEPGGETSVLDPEAVILVQLRGSRTEVTDQVRIEKMRESMEIGEEMMIEATAAEREVRETQEAIMMNGEEERNRDAEKRMRMIGDLIGVTAEITEIEIDTEEITSNRNQEMIIEMTDIPSTETIVVHIIQVDPAPEQDLCLSITTRATA